MESSRPHWIHWLNEVTSILSPVLHRLHQTCIIQRLERNVIIIAMEMEEKWVRTSFIYLLL